MLSTYAIGLMSGTSLDGLDICYVHFKFQDSRWEFEILITETQPYPLEWEEKLKNAFNLSAQDLAQLHSEYGLYLGEQTKSFIEKHKIQKLDVIASHGHTVFHQPHKKFTTQIGDGRAIKMITHIPTVYDFRTQDVLLGGQGAPLVPIGDELLFGNFDACLNLGGFSNISFKKGEKRIAFDICPVNIVLNLGAHKLGLKYDQDGKIAENYSVNDSLLNRWNQLDFYQQQPPKSLGVEWLNDVFLNNGILKYSPQELIATATEHAALQISKTLIENNLNSVLVTGGGAFNRYLIQRIKKISTKDIIVPASEIIEAKEALVFAFMGVLRMQNCNNVLSSATGSLYDHCSGILA